MHVIVGQGQLDKVLHATPEDRRGFIEEAAGILKHRRRKEKTVRKLEAMQANLPRLSDLTGEIRRQLTPLGKQAEVARRAQSVQFEVRDARARLLADDLVALQSALAQDVADEAALKARRAVGSSRTSSAGRQRQAVLEQLAAEATPALNAARDNWYQLSAGRERLRSLGSPRRGTPPAARRRGRGAGPRPGPGPAGAAGRRASATEQAGLERADPGPHARPWTPRRAAKQDAEEAAAAEDKRLAALLRAAADRREGLAKLAGQVGAARSRVESAQAELGRLRDSQHGGRGAPPPGPRPSSRPWNPRSPGSRTARKPSTPTTRTPATALDAIHAEIDALKAAEREGERERGALMARRDALQLGPEPQGRLRACARPPGCRRRARARWHP